MVAADGDSARISVTIPTTSHASLTSPWQITFLVRQEPETVIGASEADVDVHIPLGPVSPRHCCIRKTADGFILSDCGSRTGTFLNGLLLYPHARVLLFPGAVVSFGDGLDGRPTLELVVHANDALDAGSVSKLEQAASSEVHKLLTLDTLDIDLD